MLLLSLLYGEGIEAQKGQVSHPRSQSSDGTRSGSQADEFSARLLHVSTILTFGCGIIISDEVFPCVAEALEVLDGHRAGGGLVDDVETGAGLPQGPCRGWRAIQNFKIFIGAVEAGEGDTAGCLSSPAVLRGML